MTETKIIQTIKCGWCYTIITQGNSEFVSHGLCLKCSEKLKGDLWID